MKKKTNKKQRNKDYLEIRHQNQLNIKQMIKFEILKILESLKKQINYVKIQKKKYSEK